VDIGIETLALMTVQELAVVSMGATVAFVVLACRHVVRVIAESVAQALVNASRPLVCGVQTSALFAVFRIHGLRTRCTAVTTIPAARKLVVAVITMVVILVNWQRTITLAGGAGGIKTLARFAVKKLFVV